MATYYSREFAGIASQPVVKPNAVTGVGARVRRFRASIDLSAQAVITTADTIYLMQVPAGYTFAYGVLTASATMGTTTIAIGTSGTTGKYRAAAVFTSVDTPTVFGTSATVSSQTPLSAPEDIIATLAVASLPAAGILTVDMYFSGP